MKLIKRLLSVWRAIPVEEGGDRRTRWLLTLLSFILLAVLMSSAFVASLAKTDADVSLALIDLVKHLSYVFGSIVGIYHGLESLWPSSDRPYWGGNGWGNGWRGRKNEEPPVKPSEDDVQVE